jgi:hypothetical protein
MRKCCFVVWKYGRYRHITCFFLAFLFTGYGRLQAHHLFFLILSFYGVWQITGTSLVFSYPLFLRGMADTGTSLAFSCPFSFQSFCKLLLDCCGFIIGLSCLYFTTVNSLTEPLYHNVLCFFTSSVVKSWACTVNKVDFPLTYVKLCFLPFLHIAVDTHVIWTYCTKLAVESLFILDHNFQWYPPRHSCRIFLEI